MIFSAICLDRSCAAVVSHPAFRRGACRMTTAFVFPGQGSQAVGMGKSLADNFASARAAFEEVDAALGEKLTRTMWEGPADKLTLTENAQPALLAVSIAALRVLEAEAGLELARDVAFLAGHSLGEYSAHAAAGSLALADAARLVRLRGRAMQQAVPVGVGAMAALLGLDEEAARAVAPGQVVVSGHKTAVERAVDIAKARGARAMMLPVSAPFHCALMQPAADAMAEALSKVKVGAPKIPVVANVTAKPVEDPAEIVKLLVAQITGTVRWRQSVAYLAANGVNRIVEIGSGRVLTGLVRRIAKEVSTATVGAADDVLAFKGAKA